MGRGPLLCPGAQPWPAPDQRSPLGQRRLAVRFLAVFFIGFFLAFAFAFIFTAALAIVFLSFSLSRSNQLELENPEQFCVIC